MSDFGSWKQSDRVEPWLQDPSTLRPLALKVGPLLTPVRRQASRQTMLIVMLLLRGSHPGHSTLRWAQGQRIDCWYAC